uniref:Mucin-5AC n=1 Tax=Plectus sambesii TaxID=2011161 RepID=A0A914WR54_9BILA
MRLTRVASVALLLLLAVWRATAEHDCPNTDVLDTSHLANVGAEIVFVADKSLKADKLALVGRLYEQIACYFDQTNSSSNSESVVRSAIVDETGNIIVPLLPLSRSELTAANTVFNLSGSSRDNQTTSVNCNSVEEIAWGLYPLVRPAALKSLIIVDDRHTRRACPPLSASETYSGWRLQPIVVNGDASSATHAGLNFTDWTDMRRTDMGRTETAPGGDRQLLKSRELDAIHKLRGVRHFAHSLIHPPQQKQDGSDAQQTTTPDDRVESSTTYNLTLMEQEVNALIDAMALRIQNANATKEDNNSTAETVSEEPITVTIEYVKEGETTTKKPTKQSTARKATDAPATTALTSSAVESTARQTTTKATTKKKTTTLSASTTTAAKPKATTVAPKTATASSVKPVKSNKRPTTTAIFSTEGTNEASKVVETTTKKGGKTLSPQEPTTTTTAGQPVSMSITEEATSEASTEPSASVTASPPQILVWVTAEPATTPSVEERQPPPSFDDLQPVAFPSDETDSNEDDDEDDDKEDEDDNKSPEARSAPSGGLSALIGVIISAVVLFLLAVVLIIVVALRCCRKRRKAAEMALEGGGALAAQAEQLPLRAQSYTTVNPNRTQSAFNYLTSLLSSSKTRLTGSALSIGLTPAPSMPNIVVTSPEFDSDSDASSDRTIVASVDLSDGERLHAKPSISLY